ncbi:hypothetical protein [Raoultibacter timonensis]|uniref:Uncharacterized protein n=1 Tax=Raoultibacter timonensis TaxID=1907662 RepID=A0ABN6MGS3_9ACTN|nr:hypothetical protein [Raoultibacter timonensis]BDE95516.1 hypothetical protein CE91St30_08490 [Raoultibacter timonensis]BDF50120.1 hypothetical protein CE91St31_08500 [Raoultibacter timonensis]
MPDFVRVIIVIAILGVLAVLVYKGKLGAAKGSESQAKDGVVDEKRAKKYGPVDKAYLLASDGKNMVTFEVHYQSGKSATEIVKVYTPRYETLKESEPQRESLRTKRGNIIEITYEDGRVVDCKCSWMSFEATQLRQEMFSKKPSAE